jgi:hypothetical protein
MAMSVHQQPMVETLVAVAVAQVVLAMLARV